MLDTNGDALVPLGDLFLMFPPPRVLTIVTVCKEAERKQRKEMAKGDESKHGKANELGKNERLGLNASRLGISRDVQIRQLLLGNLKS